jgi:8-oxo-dGTP pyrophosphatase MutT (NUDIX family)
VKEIHATLLLVVKGDRILLAQKKAGWRSGIFNGVGGKVEPGETVDAAMIRETQEEINITPTKYEKVGINYFTVVYKCEWVKMVTHIYIATDYDGTPAESDEMRPQWFDMDKIPYEKMWSDDIYWLPKVLQGKKFVGHFDFDEQNNITKHSIKIVKVLT